jgi:hypothetical protein
MEGMPDVFPLRTPVPSRRVPDARLREPKLPPETLAKSAAPPPERLVNCLAFSPNEKALATGSEDGTALLWGLSGLRPAQESRRRELTARGLDSFWDDLGHTDAAWAYEAVLALSAGTQRGVPFLARTAEDVKRPRITRQTGRAGRAKGQSPRNTRNTRKGESRKPCPDHILMILPVPLSAFLRVLRVFRGDSPSRRSLVALYNWAVCGPFPEPGAKTGGSPARDERPDQ